MCSFVSTTSANWQLGDVATFAYLTPNNTWSSSVPGTWAANSVFGGQFWYEAA